MSREKIVNPAGFLATQDLKERGWTAALITRFLGEHDQTRPNGLRMGRRKLPPVKLYAEERVLETERQDDFLAAQAKAADAREKAERARQTRAARHEALLVAAAHTYHPAVRPLPVRKGARRKAREPYLAGLQAFQQRLEAQLERVSHADSVRLHALLLERLDEELGNIYDWFKMPNQKVPNQKAHSQSQTGTAAEAGAKARSTAAQPSDWRTWDWD